MRKLKRHHISISLRVMVLLVLAYIAVSGEYPPLFGQQRVPVLTVEDAVQDQKLIQQDAHLTATDANVAKQWSSINSNAAAISAIQGEERGIGAALAILQLVSIAAAWNGKKKGSDA